MVLTAHRCIQRQVNVPAAAWERSQSVTGHGQKKEEQQEFSTYAPVVSQIKGKDQDEVPARSLRQRQDLRYQNDGRRQGPSQPRMQSITMLKEPQGD